MPRIQDPFSAVRLGEAIMVRRLWLDLPQSDLAKRLEVSTSQVSKYETGADIPNALMLAKIAAALGTTPNDLLGIWRYPEGATAHLEEVSAMLADGAIMNAARAMQQIPKAADRIAVSRFVAGMASRMVAP